MALIKKVSIYAENIEALNENINLIELEKDAILGDWLKNKNVLSVLQFFSIDIDDFETSYACKIFDHFIDVVNKQAEMGVCLPIVNFLKFYNSKNIESADLYILFAGLRESIISVLFLNNLNNLNKFELYKDVCYIFDENFERMLRLYTRTSLQVEEELKEHKEIFNQYNTALDKSALVSKTDIHGIVSYTNQKFIETSGYSEEELIGSNHNLIRHPDMKDDSFSELWETITTGNVFSGNIKNKTKDGTVYYVDITILPLYDIDKNVKEYLSVANNVTELIQARNIAIQAEKSKDILLEKLKDSNKNLAIETAKVSDLNTNLEDRVHEEVEKNKIQYEHLVKQSRLAQMGEMISMIAHQWRQPLSAISATSMTISLKADLDKLDTETAKDLSGKISTYVQHLSSTIDDFRNFFKPNKEKSMSTYSELIENVLRIVDPSLNSFNIKIIQNQNCEAKFYAYPNEIKQVILNLIKNAEDMLVEKKIEEPCITITTYQEDDNLVLEIGDNGGGVPEELLAKIFDPYFSTKTNKDGTGIGLYMSKTIINEHCDGLLSVSNNAQGAIFKIQLKGSHE
ncbi:ATP-binding protein [Sulfurimonas sp.]|jgi:PAS domain S-box-containing protein|uniref:PAS domain-containing sensor histidine kinase n=1 Tax=Sulfurimonas sp. TaxID=2022749 RepID=UPI0025D963F6|nr:ATP-binding protein [Sulfurimonas sp.]MBT5934192.1 PAS domain-containing sensor histidine kinase [Sulfurimonas sp.]